MQIITNGLDFIYQVAIANNAFYLLSVGGTMWEVHSQNWREKLNNFHRAYSRYMIPGKSLKRRAILFSCVELGLNSQRYICERSGRR